tara:strand:- start:1398 stop:1655 length:258 start_codon:yes stop_codon:yes gene_type:complete
MTKIFNPDEKAKLTSLINEGQNVLGEIEVLNEGLSDSVKAIAEEMELKPSILKKAIRIAHKAKYDIYSEDHETLENILATAGKIA